jgi:IclR family transcriptional regulator, pca regulon regulatory protein
MRVITSLQTTKTAHTLIPADRDFVSALERGLAVIAAFDQEQPTLSVSEIALATAMTRAAARRHLITLERLGYLHFDGKRYAMTPKVLRLSQSYWHSTRLPALLGAHVHRLAHALGGASTLSVFEGADVVSVRAATDGTVLSPSLQPGARLPAHCTANGRVLLCAMDDMSRNALLDTPTFKRLTPKTIVNRERINIEIARCKTLGYAVTDQEYEMGMRALAVPIKNQRGETVAALNIIRNAAQHDSADFVAQCLPALLHVQAEVRTQI